MVSVPGAGRAADADAPDEVSITCNFSKSEDLAANDRIGLMVCRRIGTSNKSTRHETAKRALVADRSTSS